MNQNACASTREPRSAPTLNSQTRWSYQIYQMVSRHKEKPTFLKAGISKIGGLSLLWFNVIATCWQNIMHPSIVDILSRQLLPFI